MISPQRYHFHVKVPTTLYLFSKCSSQPSNDSFSTAVKSVKVSIGSLMSVNTSGSKEFLANPYWHLSRKILIWSTWSIKCSTLSYIKDPVFTAMKILGESLPLYFVSDIGVNLPSTMVDSFSVDTSSGLLGLLMNSL